MYHSSEDSSEFKTSIFGSVFCFRGANNDVIKFRPSNCSFGVCFWYLNSNSPLSESKLPEEDSLSSIFPGKLSLEKKLSLLRQ